MNPPLTKNPPLTNAPPRNPTRAILRRRLLLVLLLFSVGVAGQTSLAYTLARQEPSQLDRPLAEFPRRLGGWTGIDREVRPEVLKELKVDEYLQRIYTHPSGQRAVLWMSFSSKSTDQYHYPTVCMKGAGWSEDESRRARVPLAKESEERYRPTGCRMLFAKGDGRQFVYYWYYLFGESPLDRKMRELSRTSRIFLRGRRNGSLTIEVFSDSDHPHTELLDLFASQVAETLENWVPEDAEVASDLGATY